jgi:hypothetical protein
MAHGTIFWLSRNYPRRLEYRNGTVILETIHQRHSPTYDEWILQAKNVNTGACCPILASPLGRYGFNLSLHVEGFHLDEHSPAGHVMKALEKLGHARMGYGRL